MMAHSCFPKLKSPRICSSTRMT